MFEKIKLNRHKQKIKKITTKELRKRTGSVNDDITRRELVEDLRKLLISEDNVGIMCNSVNNTPTTMNEHKLVVEVYVEGKYYIISTIGSNGKVTHEEL